MGFRIESRQMGEIVVLVAEAYADERGFFMESFRADKFKELGLPDGVAPAATLVLTSPAWRAAWPCWYGIQR